MIGFRLLIFLLLLNSVRFIFIGLILWLLWFCGLMFLIMLVLLLVVFRVSFELLRFCICISVFCLFLNGGLVISCGLLLGWLIRV